MTRRDPVIDLLKCIAVLCIFNAHSTILYPVFPWLATGGYVGDALFFFCSGYTLLIDNGSRLSRFDTWYKRRLSRIWPSCLAWGLVAFVFGRLINVWGALSGTGIGWFVECILIFYICFYFIGKFCLKYITKVFWGIVGVSLVLLVLYIAYDWEDDRLWKYPFFFPVMLLGGIMGKEGLSINRGGFVCSICVFLLFSLAIVVGTRFPAFPMLRYVQVIGLPLMLLFVYVFYRSMAAFAMRLQRMTWVWPIVLWIGGLCLDFYLVKWSFLTDKLNFMFPINLPLVLAYLLFIAYVVRTIGRIIAQTFQEGPYRWREILKL